MPAPTQRLHYDGHQIAAHALGTNSDLQGRHGQPITLRRCQRALVVYVSRSYQSQSPGPDQHDRQRASNRAPTITTETAEPEPEPKSMGPRSPNLHHMVPCDFFVLWVRGFPKQYFTGQQRKNTWWRVLWSWSLHSDLQLGSWHHCPCGMYGRILKEHGKYGRLSKVRLFLSVWPTNQYYCSHVWHDIQFSSNGGCLPASIMSVSLSRACRKTVVESHDRARCHQYQSFRYMKNDRMRKWWEKEICLKGKHWPWLLFERLILAWFMMW